VIYRSAKTGRFVSKRFADRYPATTYKTCIVLCFIVFSPWLLLAVAGCNEQKPELRPSLTVEEPADGEANSARRDENGDIILEKIP
jgi:hypothetical protein